jgi:chromosome segregation ATPase
MSVESRNDNNSPVTDQRRDTTFGTTVNFTSSIIINVRQLKIDLQEQYQHDKDALNELNQRFHLFIDRIQLLQSQNSKYLAAIADIRRQFFGTNITDIKWEEDYFSSKSNLSTISNSKIDYEWDFELFQLQIGIYQKLIDIEQKSKDKRILILEDEAKQSAAILITLRRSYEEFQREVENLHAENEDLFKRHQKLTYDWCNIKKEQKKWNLTVETLKNYIKFYKNISSYSLQ